MKLRAVPLLLTAAVTALVAALTAALTAPPASAEETRGLLERRADDVRRAVFVGNNWAGTADVLAPGTFQRLGRIDVVPDRAERMAEIRSNPVRLLYFLAIRALIGEGHDQFVDDMYSSNDGRLLIVSRPSFADVVALDLRTQRIVWRFAVDGARADHMAISPDGRTVVVSASTGNVVHALDVRTGKEIGSFPSGGSPHESVYLNGGRRILHASIGMVYSPLDQPFLDVTKQERRFQLVDAETFEVLREYDLRAALDERGLDDLSTAVRPMTLSPDERTVYFQVSFFHGFLGMDLGSGKITEVVRLPNLIPDTPRELYLLDSAHHGIAMNPGGTKLCVAGTMSDYATVVDARTWKRGALLSTAGGKPYWVTQSWDGRSCYISWSGTDQVSKISYRTGRITRTAPVGDHPQRIRNGFVKRALLAGLPK